ncbi:helix-turn-helix domain-containing protein [Neobacillus niacini]|uniref:helix-turn-helix domain-containing protein n=1 Tax=Neobacillus niacini TaxID=86668 RepID=UPI0014708865|nr:helix-turn-helix domain-containing protein [Neobacillus niacini]
MNSLETNLRTTKEISELLNVSEESVRRWIRNGDLKAQLDGKSYLVDEETLNKFIQERAKVPGTTISKTVATEVALSAINPIIKGLITAGAAGLLNKAAKTKLNNGAGTSHVTSNDETIELKDIKIYIEALQRKKKKIELEYQMKLLEIEDEIAGYMVLMDKTKKSENS